MPAKVLDYYPIDNRASSDRRVLVFEHHPGTGYVVGTRHGLDWSTRRVYAKKAAAEKAFVNRVRLARMQASRNPKRNPVDPALAAAMRDAKQILGRSPRMGRR